MLILGLNELMSNIIGRLKVYLCNIATGQSSRLLTKIAAYLVGISWLLYYGTSLWMVILRLTFGTL